MSGSDDDLTQTIMRDLELDREYVEHCDPGETERIAAVLSAGRAAGKRLGWKVLTHQSDRIKRDDGKVVVLVVAV